MPARIEKQIGAVVVAAGTLAANGIMPLCDIPVPSNKKWNVNLVFQSTDGAATRNARLMLGGGIPAHGLMSLNLGPTISGGVFAVSPAGTYLAVLASTTRVDLYQRVGLTGLVFLGSLSDSATINNLAFSPDETWLAYTTSAFANVFARSVSSSGFGATLATSPATAAAVNGIASGAGPAGICWSPTGAYIAVGTALASAAGRVSVFPFSAGVFGTRVDPAGMTTSQILQKSQFAWAPDESVLAVMYAQNSASVTLYGWPWSAGAPGSVSTKSDAQLGGAGTAFSGCIVWNPSTTTLMLAVQGSVANAGSPFVQTYVWSAGAWGSRNALTGLGSRAVQGAMSVWLSPTMLASFIDSSAGGRTFYVDLVSPSGTLIQNLVSQNSATPTACSSLMAFYFLNGIMWRTNTAATGVIVESLIGEALRLLPTIGITANSRQVISGLTFEAGQRLLIGTPANTDVYSVVASAIEIG